MFYPVSGSICSQSYYLQGSLPSVCTAMSVRLTSYLFCLISLSSPVICNYTVVQSSRVYTVIQVTFIHTFIQLYIHTLILSCIHNIYTISIHTWLHQSPKVLFGRVLLFQSSNCFKWSVLNNGQLDLSFILFQVVSPKQWTT